MDLIQVILPLKKRLPIQQEQFPSYCPSTHPALGGNVTNCTVSSRTLYAMKTLAQNVRGIQIPNSGHWGPEERPDFVIKMLDNFFAGNSTKTSK